MVMLRGGCDGGGTDGGDRLGVSLAVLSLLDSAAGCGGSIEQLVA
jgi:hypothetical protein